MKNGAGAHLLRRKLVRDIQSNYKSFVAAFLICMLSTMLYCGIDMAWRGMEKNLDEQLAQTQLADLWIVGEMSDRMARDIAALPGVKDAQRRVRVRSAVDLPGEPTLELFMNEGTTRVNKPMVFEGSALPETDKFVCVLDSSFAEAFDIAVGDSLTVEASGMSLELKVGGIGYAMEYVVHSDGFSLSADPKSFGYAILSPGSLGFLPYRETVVSLEIGADAEKAKSDIQRLMDDPMMIVLTGMTKRASRWLWRKRGRYGPWARPSPRCFSWWRR